MIIERLLLKNFKRFRDAEILFTTGITGIIGNNGTGKSSLVQAIFFALYGVQATGISADHIVSSSATSQERCEVRLDFTRSGESYSLIRIVKKGRTLTHEASLYQSQRLMATGVSQVEEAVRKILGMGPLDFRYTIYAGQSDLRTLFENTPGKRKEWFQKALGIDHITINSQKILKQRSECISRELQKKEAEISALSLSQRETDREEYTKEIARIKDLFGHVRADITRLEKKSHDLSEAYKIASEKRAAQTQMLQRKRALREELEREQNEAEEISTTLMNLEFEEREYRDLERVHNLYSQMQATFEMIQIKKAEDKRLRGEIAFLQREIADLESRSESKQSLLTSLDRERDELQRYQNALKLELAISEECGPDNLEIIFQKRLEDLMHQEGILSAHQNQYRRDLEKLERDKITILNAGHEGRCPLCFQTLGSHYERLEKEFRSREEEIRGKIEATKEKGREMREFISSLSALRSNLDNIRTLLSRQERRGDYEGELRMLAQKHLGAKRSLDTLTEALTQIGYKEGDYISCQEEVKRLQKSQARFVELGERIGRGISKREHLSELRRRISWREGELIRLDEAIKDLRSDPTEATTLESDLHRTLAELRSAEVLIAQRERDLRFAEERLESYTRAEAMITLIRDEVLALRERVELLNITRTLIAEYVVYLMQVVRTRIEGDVSQILSEITGGRYERVLLDDEFGLVVRDSDSDYPIDRFSGGEQDVIAVALRISLSRYLAELHNVQERTLLIFDEIFGSQDEERRRNLICALRTQEANFPQILLISHIEELQGEFGTTLSVEARPHNESQIREVR